MNKKVVISIASALVLVAGGITGFIYYQNNQHPAYGKYYSDDFNGRESYITLDAETISFTNVDFSSVEKSNAVLMAKAEIDKSGEEDASIKHNKMNERAKEIQATLDFSSTFNGNTYDATDYEKGEFDDEYLVVYDEKKDYELWLTVINKEKVIRCGDVVFEYRD